MDPSIMTSEQQITRDFTTAFNLTTPEQTTVIMTTHGFNITTGYITSQKYITTTVEYLTTTQGESDNIPKYWGFITMAIAVFFYGVTYAPTKKFDTGDGMFFQWVYCSAALFVGIVIQVIRDCPTFHPIVMLGGVFFSIGNICVVPIVKCIGLGLGLCIWGVVNLLSGWSTGRFGFFGVIAQVPHNVTLNYIGVGLAVSSAVIFALVKTDVSTTGIESTIAITDAERNPLLGSNSRQRSSLYTTHMAHHDVVIFRDKRRSSSSVNSSIKVEDEEPDDSFADKLGPNGKRIVGLVLCVFSGLLYGQTFTPAIHVQDNFKNASNNGLDYVFATFCGVYMGSTVFLLLYCAYKKNLPKVYPRVILPTFIGGVLWSIATACWFVANKVLSEAVAFPIISTGPGIITAILGVFVFHEIKGRRNYLILVCAMSVTISGAVCTGLSTADL